MVLWLFCCAIINLQTTSIVFTSVDYYFSALLLWKGQNWQRSYVFSSYFAERIIYDDACHLKKFCTNPVRSRLTKVSKNLGEMDMVVDKLHFRNHVDKWCKENCNPYDRIDLDGVNAITVLSAMLILSDEIKFILSLLYKHKLKGMVIYSTHPCPP